MGAIRTRLRARNTLNDDLCDVVMGYTIGSEVVQSTNPYYRSTYVLVAPKGSDLLTASSRSTILN